MHIFLKRKKEKTYGTSVLLPLSFFIIPSLSLALFSLLKERKGNELLLFLFVSLPLLQSFLPNKNEHSLHLPLFAFNQVFEAASLCCIEIRRFYWQTSQRCLSRFKDWKFSVRRKYSVQWGFIEWFHPRGSSPTGELIQQMRYSQDTVTLYLQSMGMVIKRCKCVPHTCSYITTLTKPAIQALAW